MHNFNLQTRGEDKKIRKLRATINGRKAWKMFSKSAFQLIEGKLVNDYKQNS